MAPITTLRFEIRLPDVQGRYVRAVYRQLSEAVGECKSGEQVVIYGSARDLAKYGAKADGAGGYSVRVVGDNGYITLACEVSDNEVTSCVA